MLDACEPGWMAKTPAGEVAHFMKDAHLPTQFEVHPPARAGIRVLCKLSMEPVDVALPAGPLPPRCWATCPCATNSLSRCATTCCIALGRRTLRYGGNAALAQAHYALFNAALGSRCRGGHHGKHQIPSLTTGAHP